MKKTLATLALTVIAVGAFAQGKVNIINDNNHLVRWDTVAANLKPAEQASAGAAVATTTSFISLQLYGKAGNSGTADGLVALGGPRVFPNRSSTAGRFNGASLTISTTTGVQGGVAMNSPIDIPAGPGTFQLRLWENSFANYGAALGKGYTGQSPVFTMTVGSSTANSIVSSITPAFSTWAAGPVYLSVVPEPATASIVGLGLASLLIFRRRK